jgi:tetratricopeptide (TPR) repeat protein
MMSRVAKGVLFCAILGLLLFVGSARAQEDDMALGNSAFARGDFAEAVSHFEKVTAAHPADANGWENLGMAQLRAEKFEDAIRSLQKALDEGLPPAIGKYNLACAYAIQRQNDNAIRLLGELLDKGVSIGLIGGDPDLANLKSDPRFAALAEKSQLLSEPCRDAAAHPEYRQLDFWIGEWNVYSGKTKVGESSVRLILKDCAIFENWTDTAGSQGKSFNMFSPATKMWNQYWVSENGSPMLFSGKLESGEMRYHLEQPSPGGKSLRRNLTFSKLGPDKVRQYSEGSLDGGKTWTTEYDFTYVRKN